MPPHPGLRLTWASWCSQPCQIMVGLWGSSAGYQWEGGGTWVRTGALEVRQWQWREDVSGSKRWGKRRLVLGECLAVMLETGKVWCSWLDHLRMKRSSAGLVRWRAGGDDHGMGMRMSKKVGWGKPRIDTDRREQDCLMREEHGKKDVNTWAHISPAAQERILMLLSLTVFLQAEYTSKNLMVNCESCPPSLLLVHTKGGSQLLLLASWLVQQLRLFNT